jgi:hypothetical protein
MPQTLARLSEVHALARFDRVPYPRLQGYALLTLDPENTQRGWSFLSRDGTRYEDGSLSRFAGAFSLGGRIGA